MENKKDIKTVSRTEIENFKSKSFENISPFGDNYASAYAYKRTERLLIALYLVTNFVPDTEPAKSIVRDKGLSLLSEILSLRGGFRSAGSEKVNAVIASIHEVLSLLDVVHATGFISDMNLSVLKEELVNLILFLRSVEDDSIAQSVHLSEGYFETELAQNLKGHLKGHIEKDVMTDIQKTLKKDKSTQRQSVSRTDAPFKVVERHTNRREKILSILKDKKIVTVKDVSDIIVDCSEKTIQRELMAMVTSGVLKKEGERRWSTYSFA